MRCILASNWFVRSSSRFWLSARLSSSARCSSVSSSGVLPSSFFSSSAAWACNLRCSCKIRPASPLTSRAAPRLHASTDPSRSFPPLPASPRCRAVFAQAGGRRLRVGVLALLRPPPPAAPSPGRGPVPLPRADGPSRPRPAFALRARVEPFGVLLLLLGLLPIAGLLLLQLLAVPCSSGRAAPPPSSRPSAAGRSAAIRCRPAGSVPVSTRSMRSRTGEFLHAVGPQRLQQPRDAWRAPPRRGCRRLPGSPFAAAGPAAARRRSLSGVFRPPHAASSPRRSGRRPWAGSFPRA